MRRNPSRIGRERFRWLRALLRWVLRGLFLIVSSALLMGVSAFLTIRIATLRQIVRIPDLTGRTLEDVMRWAESHRLRVEVRQPGIFSDTVPPQHVALQQPAPGTPVKPGRAITVYLSMGPATIRVPQLVGETFREARLQLQQLGLAVGDILWLRAPGPSDIVLQQDPPAGTAVPHDTPVHLVVNRGRPKILIMPDVIGQPLQPVLDFFQKSGYRVSQIAYEVYAGLPPGIIIRQVPNAGYPLRPRDIVMFVVSRAP